MKNIRFILIVADQNCQFYLYCHRSKLPDLSILLQMKKASFICIVQDEKCQFDLHCWGYKMPVFCFVSDQEFQFYLHCCETKLPVLSKMSQIKIDSFSLWKINASLMCFVAYKKKMPVISSLLWIKVASFISIVIDQNCQFYPYC